ncbi:SMI1/KNR4 family protein [Hymenobacter sp. BT559]|uniref:SMI1/KNR4 family protein n=1 Tax=Hymenobacter sp. BT559 TaxID=2795729 RepID=UPI0018EC3691|nr:SMI1/KNR4 family protein [Hymenobacter sp. BT559]MBJ6145770.1 SMI1/KNR4 family protein [Hymenobacter sp. BT559]
MNLDQLDYVLRHLKADGVSFDAGLTTDEVQQLEQTFGFRFPADLRALLQAALPVSDGFVPWRWGLRNSDIAHKITERLQWPVDGIVFDVTQNSFWLPQWGTRPADKWQQEAVARQQLASCPQLIPIYSHRYLPALPCESGNPVFSVYGTDIVYYGYDLFSYLVHEFNLHYPLIGQAPTKPKHIAFWSDFDEPTDIRSWGYWDEMEEETT